jgi:hypothetical protein
VYRHHLPSKGRFGPKDGVIDRGLRRVEGHGEGETVTGRETAVTAIYRFNVKKRGLRCLAGANRDFTGAGFRFAKPSADSIDQLQRDSGLSHFEYGILAALSSADAATLRMSELAIYAKGKTAALEVAQQSAVGWLALF